jgi:hypothetical protein
MNNETTEDTPTIEVKRMITDAMIRLASNCQQISINKNEKGKGKLEKLVGVRFVFCSARLQL